MATNPLADLTYFNNRTQGGVGAEEINTDRARQLLANLQQYDPNAQFVPNYNSDGYLSGYTLNFDASKLPGASGTGALGGASGVGTGNTFMPSFSTVQDQMQLSNPNAATNSPTYGRITSNTNINQPSSLLDTLGPLAVAAFAGAGGLGLLPTFGDAAGAAGAAGGAASGAASGASPLFDMGPWSGTGVADMTAGTGLTDSLAGAGAAAGAGAGALDTSGDSYLGLTDQGFPAFQGVPANPIADALVAAGMDPLTAGSLVAGGSSLLGKLPNILGKIPGLLGNGTGTGSGGGGGGGGGLISADQKSPYSSLLRVLQQYYGKGAM